MQLRVLIADDEPIVRESIADKIGQSDARLIISGAVGNGRKALEWLNVYHADICVTDIRMPEMGGLELIRHINRTRPWMKTVIVSSYSDFAYAREGIKLNVSDYILKPLDRQQLNGALGNVIRELADQRSHETRRLLMRHLSGMQSLMEQWKQLILTVQVSAYPMLVVDTLKAMEQWVGESHYLLEPFARLWLELVSEKVDLPLTGQEAGLPDVGFPTQRLERERLPLYYRLMAVSLLETGISRLIGQSRESSFTIHHQIVYNLQTYLKEHYNEKINVSDLTRQFPVSRSYLSILFKQVTGTTIFQFLTEIRMKEAKKLLMNPDYKVFEISNRVGYENSEHFTKLFKEYCGITPREYRNNLNPSKAGE
ncbi:response regulator [Paenibacillus sp. YN15]|uniref:response regulator transcription factor n=1 Tax=Paenibacillus sp. YN15 TaxID=1742774 RepID=UPI0015EC2120|nr:response regulator [Paenibacillus sp. YN15]